MFGSGSHSHSSAEAVVYLDEVIGLGTVLMERADLTKIIIQ